MSRLIEGMGCMLWLCACVLLLQPEAMAGDAEGGSFRQVRPVTLPAPLPVAEGTVMFRLAPRGWGHAEGKWHFFLLMEDAKAGAGARLMVYKFPNGDLKLLWQESKDRIASLAVPVRFEAERWYALAFTWRQEKQGTAIALYVDGNQVRQRVVPFQLDPGLLGRTVRLGEVHAWNPVSSFGSEIKGLEVMERCLSAGEMALRSAPSRVSFETHDGIPGVVNRFSSIVLGADDYRWSVSYLDSQHGVLGRENVDFRGTGGQRKPSDCQVLFTPPSQATTCRFQLSSLDEPKGAVSFASPRITPGTIRRRMPDCYWHGDWIWDDRPFQAGAHRYLRRTFEIEDASAISSAHAQWLTDNSSVLYLNGHRVGRVTSWAKPAVSGDLSHLLRTGKNVLAADGFCEYGAAAFLGELTINTASGTRYIASDVHWKVSDTLVQGWEKPDFDDGAWASAVCRVKLGLNPYGLVSYRYLGKRQSARLLAGPGEFHVQGLKDLDIPVRFKSAGGDCDGLRFRLSLWRGSMSLRHQDIALRLDGDGVCGGDSRWHFPSDAPAGVYRVRISHPALDFGKEDVVAVVHYGPRLASQAVCAEVKRMHGSPRLIIDGRPQPLVTYKLGVSSRDDQYAHIRSFCEAGVRIIELPVALNSIWQSGDVLDFRSVERSLERILFAAPVDSCKVILSVEMCAPQWWLKEHPDERTSFPEESIGHVAFSSQQYLAESNRVLATLIAHLEQRSYANRIIGYFWAGGEDSQWMQWVKGGSGAMFKLENKRLSDYSKPMRLYFQGWLKEKYRTVSALNHAWNARFQEFSEVMPPSEDERKTKPYGFLFRLPESRNAVDFQQALSDAVTDVLLTYSRTAKRVTSGRKVVGVYYGKMFTIGGHNEWAEFGFEKLLKDSAVDIFSGPTYFQRLPGRPHAVSAPLGTIALHGKLFVDEADLRTYAGGAKAWAYTGNPWDTVHTMRKICAFNLVENQAIRWYDIHPGEFATPVIMETIRQMTRIAQNCLDQRPRKAEIAVITSEKGLTYGTLETDVYMRQAIREQGRGMYARLGAPVDFHLLEDMVRDDFPRYKLYVLVNAWHLDQAQREAIRKLQRNGAVLVWFHAPGFYSERGCDMRQIEEVTGIALQKLEPATDAMVLAEEAGCPFLSKVTQENVSLDKLSPIHVPVREGQQTFGRIGDAPAGAWRVYPNWTSVYLAAPVLSPRLMANLARYAGCHLYGEPGAMLYVGDWLLGIHAAGDETRQLSFPNPIRLKDLFTGQFVNGKASRQVTVPLEAGETRLFEIVP